MGENERREKNREIIYILDQSPSFSKSLSRISCLYVNFPEFTFFLHLGCLKILSKVENVTDLDCIILSDIDIHKPHGLSAGCGSREDKS